MDANGQVITLPGVIVTNQFKRKEFIPFDNILHVEDDKDGTWVHFKQEVDGMQKVLVIEKISTIFSPEEAAKFSVEFGGAFMRGMAEKIGIMRKFQGS